jgi:hypothetical protein
MKSSTAHASLLPAPSSTTPVSRKAALRTSLARALSTLPPEGDLRAFGFDDLTCVIKWRAAESTALAARSWTVELRLRRGPRCVEHQTTVSDLAMVPRWAEHHLLFFDLCGSPSDAAPIAPGPTEDAVAEALERLRARLAATPLRRELVPR